MADRLAYPPAVHILRDLGLDSELRAEGTSSAWVPVTPFVAAAWGGVRAGVLATLVDLVGGGLAVRAAQPDWIATADLALAVVAPATGPFVEARASVARRGRTTLVIEVHLFDAPGRREQGSGPPIGWGSMTFAILPRRDTTPTLEPLPDEGTQSGFSWGEAALEIPVADAAGIRHVPARGDRPASTTLEITPYVHNSMTAVQGGTMALLGDVAGAAAVGDVIGADATAVDLQVTYLALGRTGPIRAETEVLASDARRGSATVHLFEEDGAGRLTTVVNVVAVAGEPSSAQ